VHKFEKNSLNLLFLYFRSRTWLDFQVCWWFRIGSN